MEPQLTRATCTPLQPLFREIRYWRRALRTRKSSRPAHDEREQQHIAYVLAVARDHHVPARAGRTVRP